MVPFPYRVGPEQRSSRPEYAHTPVPFVDLRPPDPSRIDLEAAAPEGEHDQVDAACRLANREPLDEQGHEDLRTIARHQMLSDDPVTEPRELARAGA